MKGKPSLDFVDERSLVTLKSGKWNFCKVEDREKDSIDKEHKKKSGCVTTLDELGGYKDISFGLVLVQGCPQYGCREQSRDLW